MSGRSHLAGCSLRALAAPLLLALLAACGNGDRAPFIDWQDLRNPILGFEDRALEDVAVVFEPTTLAFYVFASTRFEPSDPEARTKLGVFYRTRDFIQYEPFHDPDLVGPDRTNSPDVSFLGGLWRMAYQQPSGFDAVAQILLVAESRDLVEWDPPRELAPETLDPTLRNIDGALALADGYYYLGLKNGSRLEDWTTWVDKTHLDVPFADWNPIMHANSAFLADWREHDGHFYLFYAGSADGERFDLRGHGKIGVARSRDLREWHAPPG